jgi:hypothetical protein
MLLEFFVGLVAEFNNWDDLLASTASASRFNGFGVNSLRP